MQAMKQVSELLAEAYRRTEFRVSDRGWEFVLRHGEHSTALEACHAAFRVSGSAYITAWNPGSESMSLEENEAAQARLEAELTALNYLFLRGEGVDPTGSWPGEPSVLVLGISGSVAQRLGLAFGQNAIVVAGKDAVARVVMVS